MKKIAFLFTFSIIWTQDHQYNALSDLTHYKPADWKALFAKRLKGFECFATTRQEQYKKCAMTIIDEVINVATIKQTLSSTELKSIISHCNFLIVHFSNATEREEATKGTGWEYNKLCNVLNDTQEIPEEIRFAYEDRTTELLIKENLLYE